MTQTTPPHSDDDSNRPASAWRPPDAPGSEASAPSGPPYPRGPLGDGPQYAYGAPSSTVARRTNRLAIVALVTGLCGLVLLAVGFAIAALVQAGRRGERGKGLAIGGLVASAVWCVAVVVALVVVAGSLVTTDRDASGRVTGKDKVLIAALRVGDCFTGFEEGSWAPVTALPCTRPHQGEVAARARLRGAEYPGDEKTLKMATDVCLMETLDLEKSRYAKDLDSYVVPPNRTSWKGGDRETLCLLLYSGSEVLTAPLAKTLDPNLRTWRELVRGQCFDKFDERTPAQRVVPCDRPHWSQVYATFTLPAGPYPGEEETPEKAEAGCDRQLAKVFGRHRPREMVSWLFPNRSEWEGGLHTVVCFLEAGGRPLRRSMLP